MDNNVLLLDSITDATPAAQGMLVISGSHGGHYPAAVASRFGVRAVLFNDAGIGLERAGVAGVLALADVGMAAAALDCNTCRIGSATDAQARGRVSVVNRIAKELGVAAGMTADQAIALLDHAPTPTGNLPPVAEARQNAVIGPNKLTVQLLDSASLVGPEDAGQIVITGSHGGLIGGDPARALKAPARLAVFNDAGFGVDDIGITRLPALDARAIAALTVSCQSARIGDAGSALQTGVISRANETALALGAVGGLALSEFLGGLE